MKWLIIGVIVAATTTGEVLQAKGMRRHGEIRDFRPGALGRAAGLLARNWMVGASVAAMAVSFFAYLRLLTIAELSLFFWIPTLPGFARPSTGIPKTAKASPIIRNWFGCREIGKLLNSLVE